jgi:hypothetical protein
VALLSRERAALTGHWEKPPIFNSTQRNNLALRCTPAPLRRQLFKPPTDKEGDLTVLARDCLFAELLSHTPSVTFSGPPLSLCSNYLTGDAHHLSLADGATHQPLIAHR